MTQLKLHYKLLFSLVAVIFAAWGYLFYQHWLMSSQPMSSMWMPPSALTPWQWQDYLLIYSMWAIMMCAMMLPSAIPMIYAFSKVSHQRSANAHRLIIIFIFAYFLVWLLFSVALSLLQKQLHDLNWLSPMMENQNRLLSGGIFLLTGLYQLTPVKNACLKHCQTPVGFLLNHWRNGQKGAFIMGFTHGLNCLGCCWAQMLLMFSVGVMNIIATALITLLILIEKTLPLQSRPYCIVSGLAFCVWGSVILGS